MMQKYFQNLIWNLAFDKFKLLKKIDVKRPSQFHWTLRMECNAIWTQERSFWISTYYEWYTQWFFWIFNCLHQWCSYLFKKLGPTFQTSKTFFYVIKRNGLIVSTPKMKLFQTKIQFLAHDIFNGTIKPIQQSIEFVEKFSDEIKDKNQL